MTDDPWLLSGDTMMALLDELGRRLEAKGIHAELYVVGGAAMAMAYDARRSSADIDAVIVPADVVLEEARLLALEHDGLSDDWLNDAVVTVLPAAPDHAPRDFAVTGTLSIKVASPEYLLGMKCTTGRMIQRDKHDAAYLCAILGITDIETLISTVSRHHPSPLSLEPRRWFLEEIIEESQRAHRSGLAAEMAIHPRKLANFCNAWMPRSKRHCAQAAGHAGQHR